MESEVSQGFVAGLSKTIGTSEEALRLLITLLVGYPLAIIHRYFIYNKPANVQHLFFIAGGLALGFWNFGAGTFHSIFTVFFSYFTLVIFRGTETCVAITFIFNMSYLLIGYYYSSTDDYDINWTLPQCVLVLRLIGLSFDLYDGNQPENSLSESNKIVALKTRPTFLEYCGHMFFPTCYLIGPQFPMKRYQGFVNGEFSCENDPVKASSSIQAGIKRFLLGVLYMSVFQALVVYVPTEYIISEEYYNKSFVSRMLILGLWGRIGLYKYISCWLLTEGACIMFGLTYNGKDDKGNCKWDGLSNVDLWRFENATEFNHYIQSFNTNTNHWVAQYIYKRLKFLGNRYFSQLAALIFLAIWHGFHFGYYVTFFFEFLVMYMEKDIHSIFDKNPHLREYFNSSPIQLLRYILLRLYTFVFMGWCFMPFALMTADKFWLGYKYSSYCGIVFFVPWAFVYGPIFRISAKALKPKLSEREHVN